MPFPESGLVYDYKLDDGGITKTAADDDEDEDEAEGKKQKVNYPYLISLKLCDIKIIL